MVTLPLSISIIGFGAFGQLLARLLAPHAEILVLDPSPAAQMCATETGLSVIGLTDLPNSDLVLLAMPVPALESVLREIAPHLRPGQIVADVCSIKEEPVAMMERHLPSWVEILATHPMFGPRSTGDDLSGLQVVLCPVRGKSWRRIGAFIRHVMKADIIVTTPEDHDRQAALTQGLTHLLARGFADLGAHPKIGTKSSKLLAEALAIVESDAPEVFDAITTRNRHVAPAWNSLLARFEGLLKSDQSTCRDHEKTGSS